MKNSHDMHYLCYDVHTFKIYLYLLNCRHFLRMEERGMNKCSPGLQNIASVEL